MELEEDDTTGPTVSAVAGNPVVVSVCVVKVSVMLPYTIGDERDELATTAGLADVLFSDSAPPVAFALTCTVFDEVASANRGTFCETSSN